MPAEQVTGFDARPPRDLVEARFARVRAALAERGFDGLLVTGAEAKGWLSTFTSGLFIAPFGAIVLTQDSATFVVTQIDYAETLQRVQHMAVVTFDHEQTDQFERLAQAVGEAGISRLAIEAGQVSGADVARYRAACERLGVAVEFIDPLIGPLRFTKDWWEIEQVRAAQEVNRLAFEGILPQLVPGAREWDIAVELERLLRSNGAGSARMAFQPMVASGPNSTFAHASVTQRRLERGDLVLLDFGATWNGYCSDCSRTVVIGEANPEQRALHAAVLAAQEAAIAAIRPGVTGAEVHAASANVLKAAGYGAYLAHGLGHGVGLQLSDGPLVRPRSNDILRPGHIVTIEPGVYIPGLGGVRIEDNVLVTEAGHENLSTAPKQLLEL
ncbi:MAG: hypothetical protein DCC58_14245 [Chloroflexi bacterium]|nr:MAG: hypothetical protein DCC58_14245 [Chloroflexota bacterium]